MRLIEAGHALRRAAIALEGMEPGTLGQTWTGRLATRASTMPNPRESSIEPQTALDDINTAIASVDRVNASVATAANELSLGAPLVALEVGGQVPVNETHRAATAVQIPRREIAESFAYELDRPDVHVSVGAGSMQVRLLRLERAQAFAVDITSTQKDLRSLLQAVVDSSRDLVGARYAALGVIGRGGGLYEFVHSGMDDDTVARIGALPRGRGILGLLTTEPTLVRLGDLNRHPNAVGLPPGHPPMNAFLGAPIQVGGEVFGNLYLTEPINADEFTSEDERVVAMMAATAGGAIANARRLAESEERRRWLAAASLLSYELLAGGTKPPLQMITDEAALAADADIVTLTMPDVEGTTRLESASGSLAPAFKGTSLLAAETRTEQVTRSGRGMIVEDGVGTDHASHIDMGPVIIVPLGAGARVRGALAFGRTADRPAFTIAELDMAASFATQAALALELIEVRERLVRSSILEDEERIATDMHDHVIGDLFATGMDLQAMAGTLDRVEDVQRLSDAVETLDSVIKRIRTSIFQLRFADDGSGAKSLQADVLAVASEHTTQLGFSPHVQFSGALDWISEADLIDDILAVAREGLSNCARHAQATAVTLSVALYGQLVTVEVTDNGRGVAQSARSSGLSHMRHRAERHLGTLTISMPNGGGTHLIWTAELPP